MTDHYSRFHSKLPKSEDEVIINFQDTSQAYLQQIKTCQEEIALIQQEKGQIEERMEKLQSMHQQFGRRLSLMLSGSRPSPETEIIEKYTQEIQEIMGKPVEINGTAEIIPALEGSIAGLSTQSKRLEKEIEAIRDRVRDLHHESAKDFFTKSWEKYHIILDGKVKMEQDINEVPYLLLVEWAIKR